MRLAELIVRLKNEKKLFKVSTEVLTCGMSPANMCSVCLCALCACEPFMRFRCIIGDAKQAENK